jgi:hypothetical protein
MLCRMTSAEQPLSVAVLGFSGDGQNGITSGRHQTMTATITGKDAEGKTINNVIVADKQ